VYEERPRTCASYACGVLRAYGDGEIDEATARERIERLRERTAEADAREPKTPFRAEAIRELAWMRKTWFA
jgi:hypothetical protein